MESWVHSVIPREGRIRGKGEQTMDRRGSNHKMIDLNPVIAVNAFHVNL